MLKGGLAKISDGLFDRVDHRERHLVGSGRRLSLVVAAGDDEGHRVGPRLGVGVRVARQVVGHALDVQARVGRDRVERDGLHEGPLVDLGESSGAEALEDDIGGVVRSRPALEFQVAVARYIMDIGVVGVLRSQREGDEFHVRVVVDLRVVALELDRDLRIDPIGAHRGLGVRIEKVHAPRKTVGEPGDVVGVGFELVRVVRRELQFGPVGAVVRRDGFDHGAVGGGVAAVQPREFVARKQDEVVQRAVLLADLDLQFARLDVGDVDLRAVAVLVLVSRVARPDGDEVGVAAEVEDHRVARAVGVRRRQLHRELQRLVDLFVFA